MVLPYQLLCPFSLMSIKDTNNTDIKYVINYIIIYYNTMTLDDIFNP